MRTGELISKKQYFAGDTPEIFLGGGARHHKSARGLLPLATAAPSFELRWKQSDPPPHRSASRRPCSSNCNALFSYLLHSLFSGYRSYH
jgi:hypothetical protein